MKARHIVQMFFVVWIIVGVFVLQRNIEAWCPMGGMECLYSYFTKGSMLCALQATNLFMLAAVILLTLCYKRVFCGYLCPLGAISEGMRVLAKKVGIRQFTVPRSADIVLKALKYPVLVVILVLTWRAAELVIRGVDPCYAVLTLGEESKWTTYLTLGVFVVAAFFISMPFCRWLCPLAAVLNPFSRFGFMRIARDSQTCTDCGACSKACPMAIPVASVKEVVSADCIGCMECVNACPRHKDNTLQWKWLGRTGIVHPAPVIITGIVACLATVYFAAVLIPFPTFLYERPGISLQTTAACNLQVEGVECGGTAQLFVFFLERQDLNKISGYLKVSTSPNKGFIDVKIEYDPAQTSKEAIQDAILEPYYDDKEARWRTSPFKIQDYSLMDFDSKT